MAIKYLVIPFIDAARGRQRPGVPQQFTIRDRALLVAERMGGRTSGVVVLEQETADEFAEPKLVATFGRVPSGFTEEMAAA